MENYLFDMIRNFFIHLYMINHTEKGNDIKISESKDSDKDTRSKKTARWSFITTNFNQKFALELKTLTLIEKWRNHKRSLNNTLASTNQQIYRTGNIDKEGDLAMTDELKKSYAALKDQIDQIDLSFDSDKFPSSQNPISPPSNSGIKTTT